MITTSDPHSRVTSVQNVSRVLTNRIRHHLDTRHADGLTNNTLSIVPSVIRYTFESLQQFVVIVILGLLDVRLKDNRLGFVEVGNALRLTYINALRLTVVSCKGSQKMLCG